MKEKIDKKMVFVVQQTLYDDFKEVCEQEYITMSQSIRTFMLQYIKEHKKNGKEEDNGRIRRAVHRNP